MLSTFVLVLALLLVLGLGSVLTRAGRVVAERAGLLDHPDGRLKRHPRPVVVVGGVAMWVSVLVVLSGLALCFSEVATAFSGSLSRWAAVALAVALKAAVGVLDDFRPLKAREKLVGQLVATTVLVLGGGILVREVAVFGFRLPLGWTAVPLTMLWFVLVINALNLLDGMDGMLATVGGVILTGLVAAALIAGNGVAALVALAVLGGLISFLQFNAPPAVVYFGDGGSLGLGLLVAFLCLEVFEDVGAFSLVPATALLVLPLLDTTAAVIRRRLKGQPVAVGDREHLHHVLVRNGLSGLAVLVLVAACGAVAAAGAVVGAAVGNDLLAVVGAIGVVVFLVGFGLFGQTELGLLRAKVGRLVNAVTRVRLRAVAAPSPVRADLPR